MSPSIAPRTGFPKQLVPCMLIAGLVASSGGSAPVAPVAVPDSDFTAFFKTQIEACNVWNVKVGNSAAGEKAFDGGPNDPSRTVKVVERRDPNGAVLEDADGNRLLVDLAGGVISSPEGRTVALPIRYTFCPTEIFVGPMGE